MEGSRDPLPIREGLKCGQALQIDGACERIILLLLGYESDAQQRRRGSLFVSDLSESGKALRIQQARSLIIALLVTQRTRRVQDVTARLPVGRARRKRQQSSK